VRFHFLSNLRAKKSILHEPQEIALIAELSALAAVQENLKNNVLFRRAQLRLSQVALAEVSGVSRPVISELEQGHARLTIENLAKIAVALECTVSHLVDCHVQLGDSDEDLDRRASAPASEFVDAVQFLEALDNQARYSSAGRPATVAGSAASRRRPHRRKT